MCGVEMCFKLYVLQHFYQLEYIPNALKYIIHVKYFCGMHKHIFVGRREKKGMDESGNDNTVRISSATHDLKNEDTTHLLSANQRLANIRQNNQS